MSERQHDAAVTPDALGAPPSELSAAIERLLGNPELISTVASAMGMTPKGAAASTAEEVAERVPTGVPSAEASPLLPSPESLSAVAPLLGMLSGKGGRGRENDKTCLLRALKPYVSQGRREAIDTMIRLSELSDLLKTMNR